MAGHLPFGVPSIQPSTGQGSQSATLRQAPRAADCRPSHSSIPKALSRRSCQARSTAPVCVRSGLSRFLQAKRASRASPPLLASRRSTATRCSRKSGKSPCRSTGKANIQIVVRLCRASASNQPPCKKRSALQNNQHRSSAEKTGAGQSDSDASTGSARCRLPPLAVNHT